MCLLLDCSKGLADNAVVAKVREETVMVVQVMCVCVLLGEWSGVGPGPPSGARLLTQCSEV